MMPVCGAVAHANQAFVGQNTSKKTKIREKPHLAHAKLNSFEVINANTMKQIILIFALLFAATGSAIAQLGSLSADLVFTPVTPCRIVDTRNAGGAILGNTFRSFNAWSSDFTSQGGSATNCDLPQSTNIAAVALNLVVVAPASGGWIAAWPYNTPQPLVSNLNYKAGDVLANSAILKIAQTGLQYEWNLYTTSTLHFVADVTGYYAKPISVGSLECESPPGAVLVLANSSGLATKQCSAGFIMTGGGCDDYSLDSSLLIAKSSPMLDNTGWFCRWRNVSAVDVTAFVRPRCCRIPGR